MTFWLKCGRRSAAIKTPMPFVIACQFKCCVCTMLACFLVAVKWVNKFDVLPETYLITNEQCLHTTFVLSTCSAHKSNNFSELWLLSVYVKHCSVSPVPKRSGTNTCTFTPLIWRTQFYIIVGYWITYNANSYHWTTNEQTASWVFISDHSMCIDSPV